MQPLSHDGWVAFQVLAPCAEVGGPICRSAAGNCYDTATELRNICTLARLSQSKVAIVERFLFIGESVGLFEHLTPLTWRTRSNNLALELAPLLTGVQLYMKHIHRDDNVVDVVLSKPSEPSLVAV